MSARKLGGGTIPLRGLLAQRLHDDRIQIAADVSRGERQRIAGAFGEPPAGQGRVLGANDALRFRGRQRPHLVRLFVAYQSVEQKSQGIDVAGQRDRVAAYLLGAGVVWGHRRGAGQSECRVDRPLAVQHLGDTEIQQLDAPGFGDQHVGRLEIPVHDQIRVYRTDSSQQIEKQCQPLSQAQPMLTNVSEQGLSFDVLHDQVRKSIVGCAAVENLRDVVVLNARQNLALHLKTREDLLAQQLRRLVKMSSDHFDGRLLGEVSVLSFG